MNGVGVGIGIIIFDEVGKVLLLLRNTDRMLADSDMRLEGTYTLPSGKVLHNETFEMAAIRKVKDETNIDVNENDLEVVSISNDINEYAHYVTIGMVASKYSGEFQLKDSGEFTSYGWFDLNELPDNFCEPSIKIIDNYLNKKIYSDKER